MGKCIIIYKGQKYSEEQFKEYFINNKQEFATSIARNKDVMDSFKEKMEGIDFVFSQSPELASIGSKAQYLQYLSTIFKTSQVRDIVYHGTNNQDKQEFKKERAGYLDKGFLGKGFYSTYHKNYTKAFGSKTYGLLLNIKNPLLQTNEKIEKFLEKAHKAQELGYDSVFQNFSYDENLTIKDAEEIGAVEYNLPINQSFEQVVFEPEQIHILGSKQDIEGFKSYIQNKQSVTPRQGISELFAENPQLTSIGTQEQYERYLSTIFPNSKVKDIVYHETSKYSKEKILQKGFNAPIEELLELGKDSLIWFSRQKNYYKTKNTVSIPAILNSISPKIDSHQNFERVGDASGIKKYNLEAVGADAIITEEYADEDLPPLRDLPEDFVNPIVFAAVIEPEQIHILGSKQDVEGFKNYVDTKKENDNLSFSPREEEVKYSFKATENILKNLPKVNQWYKQLGNTDKFWNKLQQDLQIPREQVNLLKESEGNTIEEKVVSFVANYSYAIEINTAKKQDKTKTQDNIFTIGNNRYELKYKSETGNKYFKNNQEISEDEFIKANNEYINSSPTQYYSNLTVPGGTNYTENEIATPAITPSIKGHAQFSTDNGIGWFRSDEQVTGGQVYHQEEDDYGPAILQTYDGTLTKTRRILEVQDDWLQKLKLNFRINDINYSKGTLSERDGKYYLQYYELNKKERRQDSNSRSLTKQEYDKFKEKSKNNTVWLKGEVNNEVAVSTNEYFKAYDEFIDKGDILAEGYTEQQRQFAKLLANEEYGWTFRIKAIIQDSAKKGYEKVLFPSGNTASKVEGHTTLEEFKKEKEDRIKELERQQRVITDSENIPKNVAVKYNNRMGTIRKINDNFIFHYLTGNDKDVNITNKEALELYNNSLPNNSIEINQLKQELERVETEGFGALKPIYNFYENTVANILNKIYGKDNVKQITDEYSNTWNEIDLNNEKVIKDTNNISFSNREFDNQEKRQNQNSKRPLTDNFVEYKNYKLALLETITKTLHELYISRRNPKKNIKEINDKIDKLVLISNNLKNDITKLEANEIVFMFQALVEEIDSLNNELDSNIDITTFKSRLEFLYKFIKGISIDNKVESELESLKTFNHPDFEKISLSVDELNLKYKSKLNLIKNNIIKSDITYYNNVLSNDRVTKEDLENMFNTPNDINWLEKTLLGINSTSGEESIIPQILKSFLEEKVTLREAEVKSYKDRLKLLAKKLNNNLDFIFEKSENGVKTGNIISVVSPKYAKKLSEYNRIASSKDKKEVEKYSEKINWLSNNAVVIDFRKLKIVKDLYGSIYPENFIYTDREMEEYEKYIREEIGPLYDKTISKILNNLENFQAIKNNILESDSAYKDANIARINPWEFLSHYYSKNRKESLKINNGTSINVVYPDASNIVFIPKRSIFLGFNESGDEVSIDTGYYNLDFNDIVKDNDKLEYWNLISEIYEDFISPTYDNQYLSKLSFAKFEKDSIEAIDSSKGLLKGTTLLRESLNSFKSFFYERGYYSNKDGIRNNYSDNTANEIRDLSKILSLKNKNEILDTAKKLNIKTDGVIIDTIIKEIATYQVMESYSSDITKTTLALLDMTALQKARQDVLPISNILLDSHKLQSMEVRDGDKTVREERKNSVEKLENWINRVVKNQNEVYRGSASFIGKDISKNTLLETILNKMGNIPFIKRYINNKSSYLLSDTDKKILEELRKLQETGHNKDSSGTFKLGDITYRIANSDTETFYSKIVDTEIKKIDEKEYEDMFQIYVQDKINSLGIPLNTAGIIQGILKTIILKSLGLNPISGIFNRIEGKNSGLIMDSTGSYWTKGNIHKANNFLAFSNFLRFLPERFIPTQLKKIQELKKFEIILQNMNLLQDRKNELDRNTDSSKFNYSESFDIYKFAVTLPEFKNQGSIILSILLDTKIKSKITNREVPIFDGTSFPAYEIVNGTLSLKEEFRTPENILNWENFNIDKTNLENNQYFLTKNKIKKAISRSQGNYDNLDVINATKNIWGRALTLFMKWMPEHVMQRFSSGENFDLTSGKKDMKGRYRYLFENNPALFTSGIVSLFIGFGMTPFNSLVGLGFSGFVIGKYLKDLYKGNIKRESNNILEFTAFTKSILISTLNYPLEFFNSNKFITEDSNNTVSRIINMIPGYNKTNLSKDEILNLQAIAKELAIKLTFLSVMLLAKKLTWDDDDDEDSNKRQVHNFIDNQLTRLISSLSNWTNPHALASDIQRFAFLKYLWEIEKLMVSIINMEEDIIDNTLKVSPLPRILHKGSLPWEDNIEYENNQWQDKFIKDINSDGEYSSKKEYYKKLREKREELEKSPKLQKYSEKERDREISRIIYKEFGKKNEKNTYTELLNNYKKDK